MKSKTKSAPPTPTPAVAPPRSRLLRYAIPTLVVLLAVVLLAPMLAYPFGSDQGAFASAAEVMSHGEVLYRDAWEIKPPGVYLLYRAAFTLFGHTMFAVRFFDLCWTLATAIVLYFIGKRLSSHLAGVIGAFGYLAFYAFGFDYWHTAQCDGFTSLPLALAALMMLQAEEQRDLRRALLAGALIGLAIITKFTIGGFLAIPVLFALFARADTWRQRLLRMGSYLLGCAVIVGGMALYLLALGSLDEMIQIVITWNTNYSQIRVTGAMQKLLNFLFSGQYLILKLIGAMSLVGIAQLILERRTRLRDWLLPLWGAVAFAGIYVQGKYFAYHWLPLLPPVGLLAGQGLLFTLNRLGQPFSKKERRALTGVLATAVVALVGAGFWGHFHTQIRYVTGDMPEREYEAQFTASGAYFSFPADKEVAEYIRAHSTPDDRIFVWGLEPLIYFLSQRLPATQYLNSIPLLTPWSPPQWRPQAVARLQQVRPKFIILIHNDYQPWTTGWNADSYTAISAYPEFATLLRTQYHPTMQIEDFEVWEHNS